VTDEMRVQMINLLATIQLILAPDQSNQIPSWADLDWGVFCSSLHCFFLCF